MATYNKELEKDFADDSLTISDICDKYNLTWDWVQRNRARYRRVMGLPPLKKGPRPGAGRNQHMPEADDKANDASQAWYNAASPIQKQLRELFPNEASTADRLEQIEIKLDRILEILEDVD